MKDKKKTITILAYVSIAVFVVFLLRLWQLQILKGNYYREQSEKNRVRVFKIPAPRGIIFDRNGVALVKNAPYFVASRSEEHTSELQSHSFISYAVFCLKKKNIIFYFPL